MKVYEKVGGLDPHISNRDIMISAALHLRKEPLGHMD